MFKASKRESVEDNKNDKRKFSKCFLMAVIAGFVAIPASAQKRILTKSECTAIAGATQNLITHIATLEKAQSNNVEKVIVDRSDGKLKSAATDAAKAADVYIEAMKNYRIRLEELGYQLQVCAR